MIDTVASWKPQELAAAAVLARPVSSDTVMRDQCIVVNGCERKSEVTMRVGTALELKAYVDASALSNAAPAWFRKRHCGLRDEDPYLVSLLHVCKCRFALVDTHVIYRLLTQESWSKSTIVATIT